jgi:hypothetical protein
MAEPIPAHPSPETSRKREKSKIKFPVYSLADSVAVAKAIEDKGGGLVSNDQLAAYLGYRSSKNGAYLARIASARTFDLITGQGDRISITPRAQTILWPSYPEDAEKAMIEAFLGVPLFQAIFEDNSGKQLPSPFGMKNALKTRYGISPSRVDDAYRSLMDSADQAGFFSTRGGRTQLIIPRVGATSPSAERATTPTLGGGSGDGGDDQGRVPPPAPAATEPPTTETLRGEYISALIGVLRAKGDADPELMAKIESLLGMLQSEAHPEK